MLPRTASANLSSATESISAKAPTEHAVNFMSLFDGDEPFQERGPSERSPKTPRPQFRLEEISPVSMQRSIKSPDSLLEALELAGLTPTEEAVQCLWNTIISNKLLNIDEFREALGAASVSMEITVASRHDIEWVPDEYRDKRVISLSTRHREGSEMGLLRNLSEGHIGLEGTVVELSASGVKDHPVLFKVSWENDDGGFYPPEVRWDLIRWMHQYVHEKELPVALSLSSGEMTTYHYLNVELDTFTIKVERTKRPSPAHKENRKPPRRPEAVFDIELEDPPSDLLAAILDLAASPDLRGNPWAKKSSRHQIVEHLLSCLRIHQPINVDTLMMCDGASPCLVFSQEEISDGENFPHPRSKKVVMRDYTSSSGEFHLEIETSLQDCAEEGESPPAVSVNLLWRRQHPILATEIPAEIRALARPFMIEDRSRD